MVVAQRQGILYACLIYENIFSRLKNAFYEFIILGTGFFKGFYCRYKIIT